MRSNQLGAKVLGIFPRSAQTHTSNLDPWQRIHNAPLILVTNDDGITAPGIRNLVESVADLGEVVVVAPDSHQSGMGHAITISNICAWLPRLRHGWS